MILNVHSSGNKIVQQTLSRKKNFPEYFKKIESQFCGAIFFSNFFRKPTTTTVFVSSLSPQTMMQAANREVKRSQIALLHQRFGFSETQICEELGVSRDMVAKWKKIPFDKTAGFKDKSRSGRPHAISKAEEKSFKKELEKCSVGNVQRVAAQFDVDRRTVRNTVSRLGGHIHTPTKEIILSQTDMLKRKSFADHWKESDFTKWCWYDDKAFMIPPPPPNKRNCPQYVFPDSKNEPKAHRKSKSSVTLLMGVAVTFEGKSKPMFNVGTAAKPEPNDFTVPREGRLRTYGVKAQHIVRRLEKEIIPLMERTGATTLCMDNASVHTADATQKFLEGSSVGVVGFNSQKMKAVYRSEVGCPPNSADVSILDAGVFGKVEMKFRQANPQNLREAIDVARKIWRDVSQTEIQNYIASYDSRLIEMAQNKGGGTSWQRGPSPKKKKTS